MHPPIVIVGASLAGSRAAQALRHEGFDGRVVVVGAEPHQPYDRPPLSKSLLAGQREFEACALPCDTADVEWRLGVSATRLDTARAELTLDDGDVLAYGGLVIATGARARRWPQAWGPADALEGVFTLRDAHDALALRAAFTHNPRVVVVGAGFIGCEVAATARTAGLDVTVVDVADQPMPALGPTLGAHCAQLHRARGVHLRLGVGVARFEGDRHFEALRLADGSRIDADVAIVAVGAEPNTEWLAGSGLALQPGVVCDATLTAQGFDRIVCAGDAAAWPHPLADGDLIRVEHWTNAAEQGALAARNLLRETARPGPVRGPPVLLVGPVRHQPPGDRADDASPLVRDRRVLSER